MNIHSRLYVCAAGERVVIVLGGEGVETFLAFARRGSSSTSLSVSELDGNVWRVYRVYFLVFV